eukprot:SAG11_NODE_408_length_9704_cov_6.496774_5_plen_99_part_00
MCGINAIYIMHMWREAFGAQIRRQADSEHSCANSTEFLRRNNMKVHNKAERRRFVLVTVIGSRSATSDPSVISDEKAAPCFAIPATPVRANSTIPYLI